MSSVKETMYKKRAGTSGMSGQLYKTKLVSLVLFKLLHDERFEYFYLASQLDDIGSFDDLCFKVKIKGIDRPVLVFIQAKHKDDYNSFVDFNEAILFHDSYSKIKQKFNSSDNAENEGKIFNGKFDDNECIFILYTNAKHNHDSDIQFDSAYAKTLNDLLATGKGGTYLNQTDKIVKIAVETILKQEIVPSFQLSSDCTKIAKDILHKFVIYAQQSNQNKVEEMLIKQIKDHYSNPQNLQVRPDAIFLNYHGAVQAWWLLKDKAPYLTKETQIYQDAMNNIVHEPLMSSLKTAFNMTKMKDIEYTTQALESLQLLARHKDDTDKVILADKCIIVTDVTTLTTIKVNQYLNYKGIDNYTLLDLGYTINLSTDDFGALKVELKNTNKFIIIVCERIENGVTWYQKYLKEIAQTVEEKQKIVITNSMFVDMVLVAFAPNGKKMTNNEICDDSIIYANHSLVDFTQDSQKNIIKNAKVTFHGQLTDLNFILDDTSSVFIEGAVLNKIILNETIELGEPLSNPNYDEISDLCLDRAVEIIKPQIIPGNICVTAVDYILGDILQCYKEDQYIDCTLFVNLLEDPNIYARTHESSDSNKGPLYIDFNFVCFMNVQDTVDDYVQIVLSPGVHEQQFIFQVKKEDVTNKIWIVKITLFDCTKLYKMWHTDKKTDKNTLNTLRNMCEGVVFDNIVRNENCQIYSMTGDLTKVKANNLFSSSSTMTDDLQKDFAVTDPSWAKQENTPLTLKDKKCDSGIKQKKYIYYATTAITHKLNFDDVDTSSDKKDNATTNYDNKHSTYSGILDEEQKRSDIIGRSESQKSFIDELSWNCMQKIYSVVPKITVTSCNDKSDDEDEEANNDKITLGPIIALPWHLKSSDSVNNHVYNFQMNYSDIRQIYVKTFDDIKDDVVLLTAKAGLGKSTLLTHLYRKQKKQKNDAWIIKINLVNYSGKFRKWQENKNTVIDTIETLIFLCHIIIKNENITVALKESCNKVYLENCSGDAWCRFNLSMFLHFYNERKLLMLFDGFDEICPDYENEVLKLLQVVKHFPQRNKMWITTRPYNSILPNLEHHFGSSFMITYFNKNEQSQYLSNFWLKNFANKTLNERKIKALLRFISQIVMLIFLDMHLKVICYDFYNFIISKFPLKLKSPAIKSYCEIIETEFKIPDTDIREMMEINEFLGTPLLLYLSATYFVDCILNYNKRTDLRIFNSFVIYEHFIKIKLSKILFEDKCGLNVHIPFINEQYESELQESITIHKKLGAHAMFGSPLFIKLGVNLDEFKAITPFELNTEAGKKEFSSVIDRIKVGKERTGLISHVTSDHVPVFIHKTFAEFFAFEYVYDILKTHKLDYKNKKLLLFMVLKNPHDYEGLLYNTFGSMHYWLWEKVLIDLELENILSDIDREQYSLLDYLKIVYSELINSSVTWQKSILSRL